MGSKIKQTFLFISPTLGGGGAERVLLYILNYLSQNSDFDLILLLLQKDGHYYLNDLSPKVKVITLNLDKKISLSGLRVIQQILQLKPNFCFVGYYKLNILMSFFIPLIKRYKCKFIARETCIPSIQYPKIKGIIRKFICYFYNKYDAIIAQSKDMSDDLIAFGINRNLINLINNPLDIELVNSKAKSPTNFKIEENSNYQSRNNYVAIGRLTEQKNYELLFKRIAELKFIPFNLHILGKGPLEGKLKKLCYDLNIDNHVFFHGYVNNPYPLIKNSDGIILSSSFEGFPNVLLEANALGKPIFANACKGGINEIVVDSINGYTCDFNNQELFQEYLDKFISTEFDSNRIKSLTKERYSLNYIMSKYYSVFQSLVSL